MPATTSHGHSYHLMILALQHPSKSDDNQLLQLLLYVVDGGCQWLVVIATHITDHGDNYSALDW